MNTILIGYKIIYPDSSENTNRKYDYNFIVNISRGLTLKNFLKYYHKILIQEIETCKYAKDRDEILECFEKSEIELSGEKLNKSEYSRVLNNRNVVNFKINMSKSTKNLSKLKKSESSEIKSECCVVM